LLTAPLTYSAGGLMMTCSEVKTCSLFAPINICCADLYLVILLYTSLDHFVMPSFKFSFKVIF